MVSIARLRTRRSGFVAGEWMLDSGAFSEIAQHGRYRDAPEVYAAQVARWSLNGQLVAAVSQDYMCEAVMLEKTGLTIADHQRLTMQLDMDGQALTLRYNAQASACPLGDMLPRKGNW